jgi:hypothetical protein
MADYELIGLNEAAPDLRAPTAADRGVIVGGLRAAGLAELDGGADVNGDPVATQSYVSSAVFSAITYSTRGTSQAVENISATTGLPFADPTQSAWSAQMTERFTFFVPADRTTEIQLVRNGVFGAYLATDGKFRVNYGGSYQTVQPITTSNDWVDVIFSYADNGTSAVTFDVTVNGVDFGTQQVAAYSDAFIRSIWASDYGFLHVASMGYGHLTNAATTKMNNYGDACGSLPSVAGSSVVLAQATSTARPLIGRVPVGGRRNILLNTSVGTTRTATVTAAAHTLSFSGTGSVTLSGVGTSGSTTGVDATTRVSRTFTPSAGTLTMTVAGTVTNMQLELGSTATAYQAVGSTARDITESGIPDQEYLFFDRADDILAGTVSAITGGEIIFAGRNGIWHDSLTVSAGTWQIGATTYTGGPAGLLAVVGDYICSAVISGRAFTTEERDAIYALARARGAPGVFTLGAELVTNGDFSDGATGWTLQTGWAVTGEQLINTTGANDSRAYSSVSTTASTAYVLRVSVVSLSGVLQIGVRQNDQAGSLLIGQDVTSSGTRALIFTATSGTSVVRFADYFTNCTIDNVSVKAITLTPWS